MQFAKLDRTGGRGCYVACVVGGAAAASSSELEMDRGGREVSLSISIV